MKSKLYDILQNEIKSALSEYNSTSIGGNLSIHPFDNHLATQPDRTDYHNLYEELSDAVIMEMLAAYSVDQVRELTRHFAEQASQGPGGLGGYFNDAELEGIMELVFDKVQETFNINLRSDMPEDRSHPKYMPDL